MDKKRTVEDIGSIIRDMDRKYDANFGTWVRGEENIDTIVFNLKKYIDKYSEQIFSEALKWITEKWRIESRIAFMKKLLSEQLFRDNSETQKEVSKRNIRILRNVLKAWKAAEVTELITSFLTGMEKEERKLFLLWVLEEFNHEQITEIFIRIDHLVDWSTKISILKSFKYNIPTRTEKEKALQKDQ